MVWLEQDFQHYTQNGYTGDFFTKGVFKVSHGFPLGWYGYSQIFVGIPAFSPLPEIYWFSLVSLLLDAAFWIALSFFVAQGLIAIMKSVNILHKTRASKNLSVINI